MLSERLVFCTPAMLVPVSETDEAREEAESLVAVAFVVSGARVRKIELRRS